MASSPRAGLAACHVDVLHTCITSEVTISGHGVPAQEQRNEAPAGEAAVAAQWLSAFEDALKKRDEVKLRDLFLEDAYWRDLVAFSWDIGWIHGSAEISRELVARADDARPEHLSIAAWATPPRYVTRATRLILEVFFEFRTLVGSARGVVRLAQDTDAPLGHRAWTLMTAIHDLKGFEEPAPGQRMLGLGFDRTDTRQNWLERRRTKQRYDDREPDVLIVGGGHSGVMAAARLTQIGIDALVVDRFPRIGDNWRTRYSSLALHNETDVCHFPYMPFPPTFPQYLPKDKLANWFEAYVESLELNYWTSTEFVSGEYDYLEDRWVATVRQVASERTLHPKHIIMATGGVGGTPNIPALRGAERFGGAIVHTKDFKSGADFAGRDVVVVGVGTSGHDVAFDLYNHGAHVTIMQRSPTVVINIDSANLLFAHYTAGISTDEADLIGAANFIYPVLTESLRSATKMTAERDSELLERLRNVGMRIDMGEDGAGYLMKFFRYGGGYYINVGCSELIADGNINVLQSEDVECLIREGIRLTDGTVLQFDAVVLATGYLNQQTELRRFFGGEVADRVGVICGFDERGEICNGWRQTAQRGLWFMVGGFGQGRIYSMPLAVQIAAAINGTLPGFRSAATPRDFVRAP